MTKEQGGVEPGAQINAAAIQVPMRKPVGDQEPTRVVRMAALAKDFANELEKAKHPTPEFTSAELAVEMVESPGLVEFHGEGGHER